MPDKISNSSLGDLPSGVVGPAYDRDDLSPGILHVGVGNFHRAHMAVYLDRLFGLGESHDWAIVGAGVRSSDAIMRDKLQEQDWLTTVVELDPDGLSANVTGGMIDFIPIDAATTISRMRDADIRIVSLTITEGGYYVDSSTQGFDASHIDMIEDAKHPNQPLSVFGMMILALRQRRDQGIEPFTIMSCDNLPENGHVTKQTVTGLARLSDPEFADWIDECVAFPCGMVDCITPATSDRERDIVRDRFGIIDAVPVVCEPFRQWVLEDNFPHGRPALEKVGVEFVQDVAQYELMKLRILNGGHAAIAYAGALLGHHFVHDAMADPLIVGWLTRLEQHEIIPTLAPIPGVSYQNYLDKVVERFSNPQIGDTIPRLCFDGSNRQPKFILPTIRDALASERSIDGLALEVALWCRYCAGTDGAGNEILPNDDSSDDLKSRAFAAKSNPSAFLSESPIFGDLAEDYTFVQAFSDHLLALWENGTKTHLSAWLNGFSNGSDKSVISANSTS